ncbi:MAG: 3-deoxy-manno-octulosonate cytidylyltransferase [Parvularculaceae bacterium]
MKAAIVIPARYGSTRLPGKILLPLAGKPLIQHVHERAMRTTADCVIVATDDERIAQAVRGFGGDARMTRSSHASGSERVAEIAETLETDIIVNLQGDEPEIDPSHIDRLIALQESAAPFASTLACRFPATARAGPGSPTDPAAVKVKLGATIEPDVLAYAADFYRNAPACERDAQGRVLNPAKYFLHVGVYAFFRNTLLRFARAPQGVRERAERLEQLRILDMGEKIAVAIVDHAAPGVDTEADYRAAAQRLGGENS